MFPSDPNPNLKPEENRAFEAGFEQSLLDGKYAFSALYYHNEFRNQIQFTTNPLDFNGQYVNVNRSMAHGAELVFQGHLTSRVSLHSAYNYTSTQILAAPLCTLQNFCDPLLAAGQPLLRRPKHSGSLLLNYLGTRWGANLGGSFVGRRADSDFLGLGITHAAGYARVDLGGWYALTSPSPPTRTSKTHSTSITRRLWATPRSASTFEPDSAFASEAANRNPPMKPGEHEQDCSDSAGSSA